MNYTDKQSEALVKYLDSLHASIEMLEFKIDFFEEILPELNIPNLEERYQRYIYERHRESEKDERSRLGFLLSQRKE